MENTKREVPKRIAIKDWYKYLVSVESEKELKDFLQDLQDSPMDLQKKALALEWVEIIRKEKGLNDL